jgi:hypothetical protein
MNRHILSVAAFASALVLAACGSGTDTATTVAPATDGVTQPPTTIAGPDTTVADTPSPATEAPTTTVSKYPNGLRDVLYCEVALVTLGADAHFSLAVWNSMGHSECPPDQWAAIDAAAVAKENNALIALKNGPRHWTLDRIEATMQLTAPVTKFGEIEMFLGATVDLGTTPPSQTPYTGRNVKRDTVFHFDAGTDVYELTADDGRVYVMQSYSQELDPTLSLDRLADLGSVLKVPAGWTYSVRHLDAPLDVRDVDGIALVVQDELRNTYQLET